MSELEQKLSEYEEKKPVSNDAELAEAIEDILSKEESLPYEYRNYELIDEATEALLILKGEDITTLDKEAEKNARNIINNKKSKSITLKRVLLIAAVLVMMSALTVSTLSVLNTSDKNTDIPIDPIDITKKEPSPDTDAPSTDSNTLNNETDSIITEAHITEPATDVSVTNNTEPDPMGGSTGCQIHDRFYHSYSDELINYIGEERFFNWHESTYKEGETGCLPNRNLYSCIEYFNIPNDVIIEIYQNDYFEAKNCNIEALLARDKEAFEYSARLENIDSEYSDKMSTEQALKYTLFYYMGLKTDEKTVEYYNRITDNGNYKPVCTVSLAEMIHNSSLTREDFLDSLAFATAQGEELWKNPHFEYNLDLLFGDASVMTNTINNLDIPEYESRVKMADALLHVGEEVNDHVIY